MSIHGEDDCYELNEDLLQLKYTKANIIIDLGWYPAHSCDEGNYILHKIMGRGISPYFVRMKFIDFSIEILHNKNMYTE